MASYPSQLRAVTLALVVVLSVVAFSVPATAAGSTEVSVSPAKQSVNEGTSVTYDVVVESADGGVSSYEFFFNSSNASAATVTDVELHGNPGESSTEITEDGSSLHVNAGLADTDDSGSVTIATVTVRGKTAGSADMLLDVLALGDEAGSSYTVTGTNDGQLTVEDINSPKDGTEVDLDPSSRSLVAGNTTTYDVVLGAAAGGVGSYEFTVDSSDASVGAITDVEFAGNPSSQSASFASDNGSVTVSASGADTNDTGSVRIATVTVSGDTAGEATLNLSITSIANESDVTYNVTATNGATLTVEPQSSDGGGSMNASVSLSPSSQTVTAGNAVTYDVVVDSANGGIGAFEFTVNSSNATAAKLTAVEFQIDTGPSSKSFADDGSGVSVSAAGANSADFGEVTIATLTVRGSNPGVALLDLQVDALANESAGSYTVTEMNDATVSVVQLQSPEDGTELSLDPASETITEGNTTMFDVVLEASAGGVGSYEFTLSSSDASVAGFTDVSLSGSPSSKSVDFAGDNGSVTVSASGTDTADSGSITLATVTVSGDTAGVVDLGTAVTSITNESGVTYNITGTNNASLTVESAGPSGPMETDVALSPSEQNTSAGGSVTYDVVVDSVNGGVGAYTLTVNVTNTSTATISDATDEAGLQFGGDPEWNAGDNSSVTLSGAGADTADVGSVTIATVTVTGGAPGSTTLNLTLDTLGNETGVGYTILSVGDATVTVKAGPPALPGFANAPSDPDDDGLYEDVNGDGSFTVVDVQAFFVNFESDEVQDNQGFFDFNGDGSITVVDVQRLFFEFQQSR